MKTHAMIEAAFNRAVAPSPQLLQRAIDEAMEAARPRTHEELVRGAPKIDARPPAGGAEDVVVPLAGSIALALAARPEPPTLVADAAAFDGSYRRSWLRLIVPPRLWRYCYGNPPRYGVDFEVEALKSLSHRIVLAHLITRWTRGDGRMR